MRTSMLLVALVLAQESSALNLLSPNTISRQRQRTALLAEGKSNAAADILARARKAAGVPEEEEVPQLFEDDLLDDMKQCLLTLEKRVKEGPGSIALLELEEFQAMSNNILADMRKIESERLESLAVAPAAPAAPQLVEAAPAPIEAEVVAAPPDTNDDAEVEKVEISDTSEDDGPAYDGAGGMGLAKGTANTWIIDGMDSMSPEEYQKAIQESISARQAERVKQGNYGNRNSSDYLNNLGGNSSGGMLK